MLERLTIALFTALVGLAVWVYKERYKRKKKIEILSKLEYHFLFSFLNDKIAWLENEFSFRQDEGREKVVKIILTNKLKIWYDILKDLNSGIDLSYETCRSAKIGSCTKLYDDNIKYLNKAIKEFKDFYERGDFSEDDKVVLRIFMEHFQSYYLVHIQRLKDYIYRVSHSEFFKDCKSIQASINNEYISIFDDILLDAEQTIAELNGSLTGLKIAGIEIKEIVQRIG